MTIFIKEDVAKIILAEARVEKEIRIDGFTPDDFTSAEWLNMICEELGNENT